VAARPVGAWERLRKWARRRPAVAGLLAALLLAVAAGVAASAHFGLRATAEAERARTKAAEADANARTAEERLASYEGALAEGVLRPLAWGPPGPVGPAEVPGLLLLAAAPSEGVRDRVLERGLADEDTARRLGRRATPMVIAAFGLSPGRRERARQTLLARLGDGRAGPETRRCCLLLALALGLDDEAFPRAALAALADGALAERVAWAEALATLAGRLGPGQAGRLAPDVRAALSAEKDAGARPALARALAALTGRLPRGEAAALCGPAARQASEAVRRLTGTRDAQERFSWYAALAALADRLAPEEAEAAARLAVHVLTEELGPTSPVGYHFGALAGRLGPREAAAARQVLEEMAANRSPSLVNPLVGALRALAGRLSPEEAAATARAVLALQLAQAEPGAGGSCGRAAAVLAARACPEGAADLEAALAVLADVPPGDDRGLLRPTLEALAGPTSPAEAAVAARRASEARAGLVSLHARVVLDFALAASAARGTPADAEAVCGPALLRALGELTADQASGARQRRARAAAALAARVGADWADAAARLAVEALVATPTGAGRVALAEPLAVLGSGDGPPGGAPGGAAAGRPRPGEVRPRRAAPGAGAGGAAGPARRHGGRRGRRPGGPTPARRAGPGQAGERRHAAFLRAGGGGAGGPPGPV
jgi:hypothetical protein